MVNKRTEAARIVLKVLAVGAAIFALIGSIGFLVTFLRLVNLGNSEVVSSISAYSSLMTGIMSLGRNYDYARVGALIIFGFAIVISKLDKETERREHGMTILTNTMSIFGFLSIIMSSLAAALVIAMAGQSGAGGGYNGVYGNVFGDLSGYTYVIDSAQAIQVMLTIAMILIMLSALAMIASLIYTIYRLISQSAAARQYAYQQYQQQYQQYQQYPQQGYPQQYSQQYPQQQYPAEQYPQNYQNNDTNNTGV